MAVGNEILRYVPTRPLRVFLAHAHNDADIAREFFGLLKADGFTPWLDKERLVGGQNWRSEIAREIGISDAVVVFLSAESVTGSGYRHKELALAMGVAEQQPEGSIFVIPFQIEPCEIPRQLLDLHRLELGGRTQRSLARSYLTLQSSLLKRASDLEIVPREWFWQREARPYLKMASLEAYLAGTYVVRGLNPDDTRYWGRAEIQIVGDIVELRTVIGAHTLRYEGTFDGRTLAVQGLHQVQYSWSSDGALVGQWGERGMEELIPSSGLAFPRVTSEEVDMAHASSGEDEGQNSAEPSR